MARRTVQCKETYKRGTMAEKDQILNLVNNPDSQIEAIEVGKFDDGKEFLTIKIII